MMRHLTLKHALWLAVLCTVTSLAFGQARTIEGTVTGTEMGAPIPGVNVVVQGTTMGTTTDTMGEYSIQVPGDDAVLVFSFIGYVTQEIVVGDREVIDVVLDNDVVELQDLVVVGYGTQRREDVTSSVASVQSDEFVAASAKDAAALIAGKVAGLNVSTPSGDPTQGTEISLRGTTTLMASSNPLVLIDGIPGELNTVPPEDIASIDVLKDGSAAAVYGSRGSNGVILITTKSYDGGAPTIRYEGYVNSQTIYRRPNFLGADDYRRLIAEGYDFEDMGGTTDWQDEVLRSPVSHTHNLSFSGGDPGTNYNASVNYRNGQGIFERSDNEAVAGRVNIGHAMFNGAIEADLNLLGRLQNYWAGGDGFSFNTYVWRQANIRNPTDRVRDDEGNWQERDGFNYDNPLAFLYETNGQNEEREIRLNGSLTWRPLQNLRVKLLGAANRWTELRGYAETFNHVSTRKRGLNGYASRGTSSLEDRLMELTATYQGGFGGHEYNLLGGYSFQDVTSEGFWVTNFDFPTDLFGYDAIEAGSALTDGRANMNSNRTSHRLVGFFSRVNYEWRNRYILMGSVRYEGNSKFGADHKWGLFPAVSAGWRLSEEGFMDGLAFFDDLKVRAGFGVTGIAPSAAYQSLTSFEYGGRFLYNGRWVQGLEPARNPNPDLRWERKEEFNLGLDFSVLDYRVNGSLDVYRRDTRDLLWNYSVPVPPYLYGSIMANVGHIRNEGIEAQVGVDVFTGDRFSWTTGMNYSTNTNRLVSLSNELFETTNDYFYTGYTGEPIQMSTHRVEIGGPIGDFYGYESVGIDENGEWIVLDSEGQEVPIASVNEDDRRFLGNGIPDHYLAWNNTMRLNDFDLSVTMRGAFGHQILNYQRMFYENPTILQYNMLESAFDPVYGERMLDYDLAYVSYYIEDGDYWKIDDITLGYTVAQGALSRVSDVVSAARVYLSTRNAFTFTGYSGIDPEVSTSGLAPGNDPRDKYPTTRTYTFGVNLTF